MGWNHAICLLVMTGLVLAVASAPLRAAGESPDEPLQVSGLYPHLAAFGGGDESGLGALMVWNERLWTLTYPAHALGGSSDKLISIGADLARRVEADYGGTHAARMFHGHTNQMVIGRYAVEADGTVHTIPISGRLTAAAEHLTDPNKMYYFAMDDDALWEVDLTDYSYTKLSSGALPGGHGKGGTTGQGRTIVANNGGGGVLAEWDGANWNVVETNPYTDVTGPGDVHGAPSPDAPVWSIGWDEKSGKLAMKDGGEWTFYRLPVASHTYTSAWYTEWPRIREVTEATRLADHLGQFYTFPDGFSAENTSGIRPIANHLRMVSDFTTFDGRLVMCSNDASTFNNPTVSAANSNLWFGQLSDLQDFGRPGGMGGVWKWGDVADPAAGDGSATSDPMLFAGFDRRCLHLKHYRKNLGDGPATFTIQLDVNGDGTWTDHDTVTVPDSTYTSYVFDPGVEAEWVRLKVDVATNPIAYVHYGSTPTRRDTSRFASLAPAGSETPRTMGIVVQKDGDGETVQFVANHIDAAGSVTGKSLYEVRLVTDAGGLGTDLELTEVLGAESTIAAIESDHAPTAEFVVDDASIIFKNTYRLPKGTAAFDGGLAAGRPRGVREVVTERSLLNACGTIFELPHHTTDGMRAITTHNREIYDFMSWRGMLVMSGNLAGAAEDGHYFASEDGEAGLWFGNVDDLWAFGAPTGEGGPWLDEQVSAGEQSMPYLMAGYDRKLLELSHTSDEAVDFSILIDFQANLDKFYVYDRVMVPAGETYAHLFPDGFNANWIKFEVHSDTTATAWLTYTATPEPATLGMLGLGAAGVMLGCRR